MTPPSRQCRPSSPFVVFFPSQPIGFGDAAWLLLYCWAMNENINFCYEIGPLTFGAH